MTHYLEMKRDLKAMHDNCDPADMTFEDHLVWEKWNREFHPENYEEDA